MFLHEPATILIAASTSWQLRSGNLYSAISFNCAVVILPTIVLGFADPFATPAAFKIKPATGEVLKTKHLALSSKPHQ